MNSRNDVLVDVQDLGKIFCRDLKKSLYYAVRDSVGDLLSPSKIFKDKNELRDAEFWANRSISFQLTRGQCIGLIGRNGAGKTTLLKLLTGLIKPNTGSITMKGRIGSLIALGAGFNPVLTGRENIFINGAILGISQNEIRDRFDAIVEFAEIEQSIDAAVGTYSSGMQVRLGFAIASSLSPDVLIIDEVLAVGDSKFRVKCYNRIQELLPSTAVILVSHNMFDIAKVATSTLVLADGEAVFMGDVADGISKYNEVNFADSGESALILDQSSGFAHCDALLKIVETLTDPTDGLSIDFTVSFSAELSVSLAQYRVVFFNEARAGVAQWISSDELDYFSVSEGHNEHCFTLKKVRLVSGVYWVAVVLTDPDDGRYYFKISEIPIKIDGFMNRGASYQI